MLKNKTGRAFFAAAVAYGIWGFSFLFSRLGLDRAEPFALLAHRFTVATALMALVLLLRRERLRLRGRDLLCALLMGLVEPVLYFIFESYGILHSTTAFSGVMIAMAPVCVMVGSALFLRERPAGLQWVFSLLSVGGVVLVALQSSDAGTVRPLGVLLLAGAVLATSVYSLLGRRLAQRASATELTFVCVSVGLICFWLLALVQCRAEPALLIAPLGDGVYWAVLLFLGGLCSVLSFCCINHAFRYIPVHRTIVLANLTTVITVFAGAVFLHERLTPLSAVCSAVIVVGIWGVQRFAPREGPDGASLPKKEETL